MNYEGEKFLLKLYRELYNEESVKHSGNKSDNKYELIKKYLERLQKTEKTFKRDKEGVLNYLKNRYYDKYVIKKEDIPDSYYESQEKIALENGYGHVTYTDEMKEKEAQVIIEEQKKSLDVWLDYLMKENTSYPMWTRYWAFQGMIKLGKYDKEKHRFTKRSKGTTTRFIDLNAEALALTIETVESYYKNKQKIEDEELKKLIESGNFGKIYAYNIWKITEEEKRNQKNKLYTDEGIWKTYKDGEAEKLVKDIEGKGTGWCIAGLGVAKSYLNNGNMQIYFTKDKDRKYTNPRVCIREEYGKIAEVRGIEKDQNLESEMNEITDKKLDECPDKEEYKKKARDMKELTKIYNKHKNKEELTREELRFLYEIESNIKGFGWEDDPRIEEIKRERDEKQDYAKIFNCKENEIGTKEEDLKKDLKIYIGNIDLSKYKEASKDIKIPKIIIGNLWAHNLTLAKSLENLQYVAKDLILPSLESAKGLENLQHIGGDVSLSSLTTAEGLENLQYIGCGAYFSNLTSAQALENLKYIGWTAYFKNLKEAKGLEIIQIDGELLCSNEIKVELEKLKSKHCKQRNCFY